MNRAKKAEDNRTIGGAADKSIKHQRVNAAMHAKRGKPKGNKTAPTKQGRHVRNLAVRGLLVHHSILFGDQMQVGLLAWPAKMVKSNLGNLQCEMQPSITRPVSSQAL
jgi:hypothetical protein